MDSNYWQIIILLYLPLHILKLINPYLFNELRFEVYPLYFTPVSSQECADALNEAIDNKEEGIMVKLADSVYKPNTRKGLIFSQVI